MQADTAHWTLSSDQKADPGLAKSACRSKPDKCAKSLPTAQSRGAKPYEVAKPFLSFEVAMQNPLKVGFQCLLGTFNF